jgi:hypothetical protein
MRLEMHDDRDVKTADALAAGVVSGGGMLAVLGAIIAAIVLHPVRPCHHAGRSWCDP